MRLRPSNGLPAPRYYRAPEAEYRGTLGVEELMVVGHDRSVVHRPNRLRDSLIPCEGKRVKGLTG